MNTCNQTLLGLIVSKTGVALWGIGREPLSYGGFVAQVQKTAGQLSGLGLNRNERVAIVLPNGPEMASCFFSVAAVATCAPLNPGYSVDEFKFYLGDLGAKLLITLPDAAPNAIQAAEALHIPVVMMSAAAGTPAGIFDLVLSGNDETPAQIQWAQPDDVALVLHTSGTTAKPKVVPLTQRNLVCSAQNIACSLELNSQDRCLNIMPLFHVHGLMGALCSSLSVGASVVCSPGFYAAEFLGWLEQFQPSWFTAVPTMHQSILARIAATEGAPKHRLRFIRSCSSALAPSLMARMEETFGVPVIEAYGMTEGSHQIASNPLPPGQRKAGSVGIAAGPQVAVMNASGQLLPSGTTGEIVIRGNNVTAGYENNPEANLKSFTHSWFRTGDEGHIDAEGYIFLTGRIKEIINRGGEKISPREIDEVLLDHPAVAQAVAFALPDPDLGEDVGAAIVLRDKLSATEQEIRQFASARLAHFKVPSRVLFLREIPKGPTGKIQRVSLAKTLGLGVNKPRTAVRPPFEAPAPGVEQSLAQIWQEVLGVGPIGTKDHFQDLGGDSLAATRVASRIQQTFQAQVMLTELLAAPALEDQARVVEKACLRSLPSDLARLLDEVEGLSSEETNRLLNQ